MKSMPNSKVRRVKGVHFSSLRMDWKTPKAVYQVLDSEFQFDHDPCPPKYTVDGLFSEWGGVQLRQSTIWFGAPQMDCKGIRRVAERQNCRIPHPKPYGHSLVARLLYEGYRDSFYQRPIEVR